MRGMNPSVALDLPNAPFRRRTFRVLAIGLLWGLIINPVFESLHFYEVMARTLCITLGAWSAFELAARLPRRLPRWIARWAWQTLALAAAIPPSAVLVYLVVSAQDPLPLWRTQERMVGMSIMIVTGLLFGPWIGITALMRQVRGETERLALRLQLQQSEHQRQLLDARLSLLNAQVNPHFLFNTLANVRELVESGAPQAADVLNSLIAYLRASVPRLQEPTTRLEEEIELARAYLEVMQMRIPDRLSYRITLPAAAADVRCLPMCVLTLVENAVRHGIDPSETGGEVEVRVRLDQLRCHIEVIDTGLGYAPHRDEGSGGSLGTGLESLRQRLALAYPEQAALRIEALLPRGTQAEIEFPAQMELK